MKRLVVALTMLAVLIPISAYAQIVGVGDAGTIMDNAVNYFQGNLGVGIISMGIIIFAIVLFVGQHRYEAMMLALIAVALYFGGPGMVQRIAQISGG